MIGRSLPLEPGDQQGADSDPQASIQPPGPNRDVFIGTAGWNVPAQYAAGFCAPGSHLERYATRLNAVEINSSFYRAHRRQTYERWARTVPEHFRFAAKVPKQITHECELAECEAEVEQFIAEVSGLGTKLGVLLVQLAPSLALDAACADAFFAVLRARAGAHVRIACEPRHASWFSDGADALLRGQKIARVSADPPRCAADGTPGGDRSLNYYRLHGSPRIYYSDYDATALTRLRRELDASVASGSATWCIFDNTAAFAALGNALSLGELSIRAAPQRLCQ